MSEPMPGFAYDDELCPPWKSELLWQLIRKKRPKKGPLPDPWERLEQFHLTLAIHQLATAMDDRKLSAGILEITDRALKEQVGQLHG